MSCEGVHMGTNTNKTLKNMGTKKTNIWVQIKNEKKIGTN